MSELPKPRIILPRVPDNYYGSSVTIENLRMSTKLYIGNSNRVEVMFVENISYNESLNSYEIYTDKAVLLATPLTRVAYSCIN